MTERPDGEQQVARDPAERPGNQPGATVAVAQPLPTRHTFLIGLLSLLLIVPVDLLGGSHQGFPLPICILLIPAALLSFLKSRSLEAVLLLLSCLLGDLSILITIPFAAHASLRPLGSFVLFFSPAASYFLARQTIKTDAAFSAFLRWSLVASISLTCSLFFSLFVFGNGAVRGGGYLGATLNGTFFLLPLSGSYGVHTLIAHYFLICIVVLYYANSGHAKMMERIAARLVVAFLLYLMLFSLSREVILAIAFVVTVYIFRFLNVIKASIILVLFSLCLYVTFDAMSSLNSPWGTTIYRSVNASDLNELSSGRFELQELALKQLLHLPLTGTGFNGYELDNTERGSLTDLAGWSTHIYYLTIAWKMGLLGACLFFLFLARITKASLIFSRTSFPRSARLYSISLCAFLLILNSFWDALLAPSVMCLFAFFVGSMSRIEATQVTSTVLGPAT